LLGELENMTARRDPAPSAPPATADRPAPAAGDASAERAIERLLNKNGHITGAELLQAILEGTADLDSQAAGAEFDDFMTFKQTHGDQLHGSAKQVMEIYEKYAAEARAAGETGISPARWGQMIADMSAAVQGTGPAPTAGPAASGSPEVADRPAKPASTSGKPSASGSSAAGNAAGAGGTLMEKAGAAANAVADLVDQVGKLDPSSKTYQSDLLALQMKLQQAQAQLQLFTQMLKALHEMQMGVIQNIRV
jgi:hypothetical protein